MVVEVAQDSLVIAGKTIRSRLMLGTALTGQRDLREARRVLIPLADGAFDPPEKPRAQQLLQSLAAKVAAGNDASAH